MTMRWNGKPTKKGSVLLLVCLLPLLSCASIQELISPSTPTPTATSTPTKTPTPTITPSPTAALTPMPLADRDLKDIALQASDLPDGFIEVDIPNYEVLLETMEDDFDSAVTENLEKAFICMFSSPDDQMYLNMVLVFQDSAYAQVAYDELVYESGSENEEVDVPLIGEESAGFDQSDSSYAGYFIVWHYREAVLVLFYYGNDSVEMDEIIQLAETIQSRIEGQ
jgi:hypothetical protein